MQTKKIEFSGSQGFKLVGRLDVPGKREIKAYALFAHCFTCTKNLKAVTHINRALTASGIAVLRFDFTGLGESEGDFADTNFSSNVEDLVHAADFLRQEYHGPKILIGHSLGGAAVLMAASHIDSVTAVATIAAPSDPQHVTRLLLPVTAEIEQSGRAEIELAGRRFTIKKQFLDDLKASKMSRVISDLDRALLIFHSPYDEIVGIENAAAIFTAAKHPKSFISLDRADHLLMADSDSLYTGTMAATWASKYI